MEKTKTYLSKDLNISKEELFSNVKNDFVGDDPVEQLEWAMMILQHNFKQMRFGDHLVEVQRSLFDKSYLIGGTLKNDMSYFAPFSEYQACPKIFPNINTRIMTIGDTIGLIKTRELPFEEKRGLNTNKRHSYQHSLAFYNKVTESFYGEVNGYEVNPNFFKNINGVENINKADYPSAFSLKKNYVTPSMTIDKYMDSEIVENTCNHIAMSYQVAMSLYYEWTIYLKEYDNIGIVIPIEPQMLSELYKTSLLKMDNPKRMVHFVRDHYRKKANIPTDDYSIYVNKYLRGEHKFNYRGFSAEIIPPKYDLNKAKTKKKFIDINE